jgi:kelch-like protein 2/3
MVRPRSGLAAVVLNDCIFAFGGYDGSMWLADGERLDSKTQTWSLLAPMAVPRSNFGLVSNDGLIYAVGGFMEKSGVPINNVEVYLPAYNLW